METEEVDRVIKLLDLQDEDYAYQGVLCACQDASGKDKKSVIVGLKFSNKPSQDSFESFTNHVRSLTRGEQCRVRVKYCLLES